MHTFYLSPEKWTEPYVLDQDEAHHLSRVLRMGPGQKVRILDGQGRMGFFLVQNCTRKEVLLEPEQIWTRPEPSRKLHLALGWNKSSRRSWLLEKAVELGAWRVVFWTGQNSQGRMERFRTDNWHKRLVSAAKQSINPWIPEIVCLRQGIHELITYAGSIPAKLVLWEQEKVQSLLDAYLQNKSPERVVVVGPEGGLTRQELEELNQAGFVSACLGPRVLRWETAALSVLCLDMLLQEHK